MGRRAFARTLAALAVAVVSGGVSSGVAFASECPNEVRREEQNATYLPDCRAYEMVSPLDKNGSDVTGNGKNVQASVSGERVSFTALSGFGDTGGSGLVGYTQYLSEREEGKGWVTHGVTPTPAHESFQFIAGVTAVFLFSETMDKAAVEAYDLPGATDDISHGVNYYIENTADRSLETVTKPLAGPVGPFDFEEAIAGIAGDESVVTLEAEADLLPGLPEGKKLYEWNRGILSVAGILPDGTYPTGGSGAPLNPSPFAKFENEQTVSRDGSRILFAAPVDGSKPEQLYLRRNGTETVWVTQSEASTPDPEPQGVNFLEMSPDGTKVLFSSSDRLTDSDPGGAGAGLYLYSDSPDPEAESNLTFIGRVSELRGVAGMSEDAKRIYFYKASEASSGRGEYLWDEGALHRVYEGGQALTSNADTEDGEAVELSADGRDMAFLSREKLTEAPTNGHHVMYVYDEPTESLRCVSCPASGAQSDAEIEPHATKASVTVDLPLRPRFLSANGRYVFFSTDDALVQSDTNKLYDVYEYDTQTGAVSLISSGTGDAGSWLVASGAEGNDVFFTTRQQDLAQDTDTLVDLYDARIGGGFPQPVPVTGGCVGDECQGVPSAAPSFDTASGFTGLGNVVHPLLGKAKPKALRRGQKLKRALKACKRKKGKKSRRRCEAQARRRYGAHKASKSTSRGVRR